MTVVQAQALAQQYVTKSGPVDALTGIDVDIPEGTTGLVGANGAGKTTLLRILLGLIHPTGGSAEVLGVEVADDPLLVRSMVGYMPEGSCLPTDQTAADFVAYAAELAGLPAREARRRSSETLFLVGLHEERFRFLGDFSTGMQQRVKLAQAIVHDPQLVLLDEPASGLDPEGRRQMLGLIKRLTEFGINVIFSSHILTDIEETCDWIVMLDQGRLLRSEPLLSLGSRTTLEIEVLGDAPRVAELLRAAGADVEVDHQVVRLTPDATKPYDAVRDALIEANAGLVRMGYPDVTLEDVFLESAHTDE